VCLFKWHVISEGQSDTLTEEIMVRRRIVLTKNNWKYIRNALCSSDLQSYAQIALIPGVYSWYTIPCLYSIIMNDLDSPLIFCYSSNIAIKKRKYGTFA
jgi:hypothetical protein